MTLVAPLTQRIAAWRRRLVPDRRRIVSYRRVLMAIGWLTACLVLGVALAGKWDEFVAAGSRISLGVAVVAVLLQIVALVARSEAWLGTVRAAGGSVGRRCLYRAAGLGCAANLVSTYVGTAARIGALRRSAPHETPHIPALIAAELPIVAVEAVLAAITSFTLVGPLGLPWWTPLICIVATVAVSGGLAALGRGGGRKLWRGLSVLRSGDGGLRLVAFVLIAVLAQIARNWIVLHAVGVNASVFDAIAVLIAVVTLSQLPIGPTVGAGGAVLILGPHGVAAAAAAGLLLTATGTLGGVCFAGWAALDRMWGARAAQLHERVRASRRAAATRALHRKLAALPHPRRRVIEVAYFGGLSHIQISRTLGVAGAV
jgi:hypothetical protein